MKNQQRLWDEVKQEEEVLSSGSIETILKFPRKINIDGKIYDEVKIETIKENNGCKNILYIYNSKEWKPLKSFEPRRDEMCEMHSDKLIGLRGEYVRQHREKVKD